MFQDFSREHDHNTRQSLVLNNVFLSSRYGENCIRFYPSLLVNNSSQCVLEKVTTHCYQGFISYIKNAWSIDMWLNAMSVLIVMSVIATDGMHLMYNYLQSSPSIPLLLCYHRTEFLSMCVIFHLMCSIFCRHRNWFVQYLWAMWALKNLSRHRWTAIGVNFPVMRGYYIVQSTTWSKTGLYRAPVAVTRVIILKKKNISIVHLYTAAHWEKECVHFMQNAVLFLWS